jgi:hypothetical protein
MDFDVLRAAVPAVYARGPVGDLVDVHTELMRQAGSLEMLTQVLAALPTTGDTWGVFYSFHVIHTCLRTSFATMPDCQRQQIKEALFDHPIVYEDPRAVAQQAKVQLEFMLRFDAPSFLPFWECVLGFHPDLILAFLHTFFGLKCERSDAFQKVMDFLRAHELERRITGFVLNASQEMKPVALSVLDQMVSCTELSHEIEPAVAALIDRALDRPETTQTGLQILATYLASNCVCKLQNFERIEQAHQLWALIARHDDEGTLSTAGRLIGEVGSLFLDGLFHRDIYELALKLFLSENDTVSGTVADLISASTKRHPECALDSLNAALIRLACYIAKNGSDADCILHAAILQIVERALAPPTRADSIHFILGRFALDVSFWEVAALFQVLVRIHQCHIPCGEPIDLINRFFPLLHDGPLERGEYCAMRSYLVYFSRKLPSLVDRSHASTFLQAAIRHAVGPGGANLAPVIEVIVKFGENLVCPAEAIIELAATLEKPLLKCAVALFCNAAPEQRVAIFRDMVLRLHGLYEAGAGERALVVILNIIQSCAASLPVEVSVGVLREMASATATDRVFAKFVKTLWIVARVEGASLFVHSLQAISGPLGFRAAVICAANYVHANCLPSEWIQSFVIEFAKRVVAMGDSLIDSLSEYSDVNHITCAIQQFFVFLSCAIVYCSEETITEIIQIAQRMLFSMIGHFQIVLAIVKFLAALPAERVACLSLELAGLVLDIYQRCQWADPHDADGWLLSRELLALHRVMWQSSPAAFEFTLHQRLACLADQAAVFAAYKDFLGAPDIANVDGLRPDSSPLRCFFDFLCSNARACIAE